jgi:pimeloyl-ACP methyl ester carboxylesterase
MSYSVFKRDGLSLRLWDSGGKGLPVIFQHGLCGDSHQTREVFPASDRFRLITLECRGHGQSDPGDAASFSIATFAGDVLALAQSLSLQRYVTGGISMGAALALRLATANLPGQVGLILARPAWTTEAAPPTMRPNALVGMLLAEFGATRGLDIFKQSSIANLLQDAAPDNLASLLGFFNRAPADVTAELLQRISADGPGVSAHACSTIKMPCLIIGHGQDSIHPLAMARALAGLLPHARLREITSKAHSRPAYIADFKATLTDFLEGLT